MFSRKASFGKKEHLRELETVYYEVYKFVLFLPTDIKTGLSFVLSTLCFNSNIEFSSVSNLISITFEKKNPVD